MCGVGSIAHGRVIHKVPQSRQNRGFDPYLIKLSIKSLVARHLLELVLKVGCQFWDLLFAPLKL